MSKILKYIDSQFGNPRGVFGKIICFFMNKINKNMYQAVVSRISNEKNILDIGYGNGYLIEKMYKKSGARIVGIDISNDMKTVATRRNQSGVDKGDIELLIGDCCNLQFENKSFDIVTTINTIYFWKDTVQGLREILRVLNDGGLFYNVVYSKEYFAKTPYTKEMYKVFDKSEYIEFGKKAGFSSVSVVDIIEGTNYIVIYKK